jgi:hypothetical protein
MYSKFEALLGYAISPSMYAYMSGLVEKGATHAEAVRSYFALTPGERYTLHKQMLENLERQIIEESCWRDA